jgi:cell division protein FtsB
MKNFFFKYIHNKFFYAGFLFAVWLVFFDQENLIVQHELSTTLHDLRNQKEYYIGETEKNQQTIQQLETDSAALEKLAREKYYMKRKNEDVFVVVKEDDK